MSPSLAKRLFTAYAIVALAATLAFGGGVRYYCYCAGSAVLTLHEHCHGTDGGAGPIDHAPLGHRHEEHGDHEEHRHELVESPSDLRLPDLVAAPGVKLVLLRWTALSERQTTRDAVALVDRPRPRIAEDPPPLSHRISRAVVRLI